MDWTPPGLDSGFFVCWTLECDLHWYCIIRMHFFSSFTFVSSTPNSLSTPRSARYTPSRQYQSYLFRFSRQTGTGLHGLDTQHICAFRQDQRRTHVGFLSAYVRRIDGILICGVGACTMGWTYRSFGHWYLSCIMEYAPHLPPFRLYTCAGIIFFRFLVCKWRFLHA